MSVRTALAARARTGLGLAGGAIAVAASASGAPAARPPQPAAHPAVLAAFGAWHYTGTSAAVI